MFTMFKIPKEVIRKNNQAMLYSEIILKSGMLTQFELNRIGDFFSEYPIQEGELTVQIVSSKEKKKHIRKLLTSNEDSKNGNIEERVIVLFGKVKTGYFIFNNGEIEEVKAKFSKKEKFAVAFVKKMSNGRETVFSERLVLYIP